MNLEAKNELGEKSKCDRRKTQWVSERFEANSARWAVDPHADSIKRK